MAPSSQTIADEEALEAFKSVWDNDATLQGVTGPLKTGKLKSVEPPYAKAESSQAKPPAYFTGHAKGSGYWDYRKLVITAYGERADMVKLAAAMEARLGLLPRPKAPLPPPPIPAGLPMLTIDGWPPTVKFMRCLPMTAPGVARDESQKEGRDIWKLTAEYEVWTTRLQQ
jgi:hypothetical protein